MSDKTFDVIYQKQTPTGREFSHKYVESYDRMIALYCPQCGVQGRVYRSTDGDYYVGETYICAACAFKFYMPGSGTIDDGSDDADQQRLAALR